MRLSVTTGQPGDWLPTNTDVALESSDIDTRTLLAYMFYLAISVAAAFLVSVFVFRSTTTLAVDFPSISASRSPGGWGHDAA